MALYTSSCGKLLLVVDSRWIVLQDTNTTFSTIGLCEQRPFKRRYLNDLLRENFLQRFKYFAKSRWHFEWHELVLFPFVWDSLNTHRFQFTIDFAHDHVCAPDTIEFIWSQMALTSWMGSQENQASNLNTITKCGVVAWKEKSNTSQNQLNWWHNWRFGEATVLSK